MAIDKERLLNQVQVSIGVSDDDWNQDSLSDVTKGLMEQFLQDHIEFLCSGYCFSFTQVLMMTAGLSPDSDYDITIKTSSDGLSIKIPDRVVGIEYGAIGSSNETPIAFSNLADIKRYKYVDSVGVVYAWLGHGRTKNNAQNLIRFQADKSSSEILLVGWEVPESVSFFPNDFFMYFRHKLIAEGLRIRDSANLKGKYMLNDNLAKEYELMLKGKYSAKVPVEIIKHTPYEGYNRNILNEGRAR